LATSVVSTGSGLGASIGSAGSGLVTAIGATGSDFGLASSVAEATSDASSVFLDVS
jgi:hypothetical protein